VGIRGIGRLDSSDKYVQMILQRTMYLTLLRHVAAVADCMEPELYECIFM